MTQVEKILHSLQLTDANVIDDVTVRLEIDSTTPSMTFYKTDEAPDPSLAGPGTFVCYIGREHSVQLCEMLVDCIKSYDKPDCPVYNSRIDTGSFSVLVTNHLGCSRLLMFDGPFTQLAIFSPTKYGRIVAFLTASDVQKIHDLFNPPQSEKEKVAEPIIGHDGPIEENQSTNLYWTRDDTYTLKFNPGTFRVSMALTKERYELLIHCAQELGLDGLHLFELRLFNLDDFAAILLNRVGQCVAELSDNPIKRIIPITDIIPYTWCLMSVTEQENFTHRLTRKFSPNWSVINLPSDKILLLVKK